MSRNEGESNQSEGRVLISAQNMKSLLIEGDLHNSSDHKFSPDVMTWLMSLWKIY